MQLSYAVIPDQEHLGTAGLGKEVCLCCTRLYAGPGVQHCPPLFGTGAFILCDFLSIYFPCDMHGYGWSVVCVIKVIRFLLSSFMRLLDPGGFGGSRMSIPLIQDKQDKFQSHRSSDLED